MKFNKIDLLTLLISLFLFASCESTSTIGLEVDPTSALEGSLVDSITIKSTTLADDPVETSIATSHPFGFLKDPIFGTTEASLALAVNMPYDAYSFGTTPTLDSAVLVLNYASNFYGDSTSTYSIDVHQLDDNITRETSFLSSKSWPYNSNLMGNKTGKLYPTTRYKINDIVVGQPDTLRSVTPQIRIPLDNSFLQQAILNTNSANLRTNINFTRYFRGLHVQVNKTESTGNGGLMFFDFTSTNSSVVFYYKHRNNTTSATDTTSVSFPITSSSGYRVAATVKHDYSGTEIGTQLANPTVQYPITYLQPLAGLKNKISFPYLNQFATNVGKVAINKAELVIDLSSGSDALPYGPAPRLSLYRYDIAENRVNLPDNNAGSTTAAGDPRNQGAFGGYFNAVTRQYVFVVTAYVQDLLDGKIKDYGTFLAPTPNSTFSVFPSISTGARSVIGSYKKAPNAGDNIMKLNIYYTKIN
ncbi:MAG: DUF4270 domain-containing protein [Flavobacteriales bacterium]|nr:MAG: DUF4270 domain-containing protein [Flavobacteriales bacterium]